MNYALTVWACAACVLFSLTPPVVVAEGRSNLLPGCFFAGYLASWSVTAHQGLDRDLVNLPQYVDVVQLSFMRPDTSYSSDSEFAETGLEFPYPASVLKDSLAALRARRPGIKVLVSVGGEAYGNWQALNSKAISDFVRDFRLDGVDIDFEPTAPRCEKQGDRIVCESDAKLIEAVKALRNALPATAILALSAPNVALFGEGAWRNAEPSGGPYYGVLLGLLRDRVTAGMLSFVSLMAYDAGPNYQPIEAYRALRSLYGGPILMGFTSPPEAWGGHVYSTQEAQSVLQSALQEGAAGAMLFHLKKGLHGASSPAWPNADLLAQSLSSSLKSTAACKRKASTR